MIKKISLIILILFSIMTFNYLIRLKPNKYIDSSNVTGFLNRIPAFEVIASNKINIEKTKASQTCKATWYGDYFHGRKTANGEIYNQWGMTTASNTYPMNSKILVCTKKACVEVKVTDRGGFTHCLDLSRGAFNKLGNESTGVLNVEVTKL